MKEIENNMYYQTGIKTSRNEDSVYAMKYASQQMMIDKLQKENEQLKENNLAMQEEMARTWAKLEQKEDVIKQLLTYLDKNKLTLNNPNILDFYINVKKILNIEKSDK